MTPEDVARSLLDALDDGLFQTFYRMTWVDPESVVKAVRASGADVSAVDAFASLPTEQLDGVADTYIRRARRTAALSGVSLGAGGWVGLPPGLGHLVVVIVRMAQRISLTYGFDYRTDRGEIELWKGLATATGANVDWEGTEAELMRRLPAVVTGTGAFSNPLMLKAFQAVVTRIALASGLRATRWVPVVGGGSGLVLNWLQVDAIGKRLKDTWRHKHVLDGFDPTVAVEVEVLSSLT
ncbi:MAG: EcsC family protein [Proteobacteria bacterium]|nr:EcsC family protein [Pseudomonadota bacterium]